MDARKQRSDSASPRCSHSASRSTNASATHAAHFDRAGRGIIAVDPAYELVSCDRRGGGWCLVIRRLSGARARADARKAGRHRDPGIAAKKQRRQAEQDECHAVREIIRRGLDETPQDVGERAA